jgi:uncharacterized repeat protein (TIGR01451 family)
MIRSRRRRGLVVLALTAAAAIGSTSANALVGHAVAGPKPIAGATPSVVSEGRAQDQGRHDGSAVFRVNVGLGVRASAKLDTLIRAASTPGSPDYGHYLTNDEYMASYAPTDADVQAVTSWLRGQGLEVLGISPNNLLVRTQGRVSQLEHAFGVTINNYTDNGRAFHANDHDPIVPAGLNVNWVSGLSDYNVYKPFKSAVTCEVNPPNKCGFDGGDFRSGYDVVGDGTGQTLGFTLWGRHLAQGDYDGYAAATGNPKITIGAAGDNGLDFVDVDGSSSISNTDNEVALDTEIAHGVAPGIHETYWLGKDNSDSTLEDVLSAAESSSLTVISNSWGCDGCGIDSTMDNILQAGAAKGQTFYFSTGDNGASVGRSRPAVSPYVVAVGGTSLNIDGSGNWSSETGWSGSGGGCENGEARPPWQTGISGELVFPSSPCTGRAEPDVAANAAIGTYLFFDGAESCCTGGTSLSAPIWAAASVIWNKHNAATGRPGIGFAAPVIYGVANDATTYANDFHDITSGNNGFAAGTGWDEVTGWGSPDFNKLFNNLADITYTGPLQASKGDSITLSGTLLDKGASTPVVGRTIFFAAGLDSCSAVTDSSGHASCPITVSTSPGHYSVIAAFGGDAAYVAASVTKPFTVIHIPTTLAYTGPASAAVGDSVTLSATLTDSGALPVPAEPIVFALGTQSCTGTTNGSGQASCAITISQHPGAYTVNVSFAGDATYNPSSTTAAFTIIKATPTLTTSAPATSLDGQPTFDTALLAGGANPGGSVTFKVYGPNDTTCANPPAFPPTTTAVVGDGSYPSAPVTPFAMPGFYRWVASYSGDIDNNAVTTICGAADETVNVLPAANLTITKTDDAPGGHVLQGQQLTYTIGVSNSGPDPAENVQVTDTIPATTVFAGASTGCVNSAGTVTCSLGTVGVGSGNAKSAQIVVLVVAATTPISNSATVSTTTANTNPIHTATDSTIVDPACTTTLTGKVAGSLVVASGQGLCLNGATVGGSITVKAGGALTSNASTINGSVSTSGARALTLCSTKVSGAVKADGTIGMVRLGDDDDTPACAGDTIGGAVSAQSNLGGIELFGSTISGSVLLVGNHGASPLSEDKTPEVEANTVSASLSCSGNVPGVTNDAQINTVHGARSGQCVGL